MVTDAVARQQRQTFERTGKMFGHIRRLHFVGIGGAGMSGIAEILANLGFEITGSDSTPSDITRYLADLGITVAVGHSSETIDAAEVVVISSAIGDDNPEVIAARNRGIPVIKRAEMLGELMRLKYSIGVAGTHGKTTTTSMIGRILRSAELEPTLIVGGIVSELGTGARLGSGDYLVAEADEYDRSFLAMFPTLAVVLNIEPDHLDCYRDLDDLRNAFLTYINRVPFFGSAVINGDDENVAQLRNQIVRPFTTFGFTPGVDYRALDIGYSEHGSTFAVFHRDELLGSVSLAVPGRFNVANALAAIATAGELRIPFETVASSLREFTGVGRRFELVGRVGESLLFDDYGHHPTEIAATLTAARDGYDRRIICIFQPHLYSRTRDFKRAFAQALAIADEVILTDIYPAREEPIPGVTSEAIVREAESLGHQQFRAVGRKEQAIPAVVSTARPGDLIMIMGAGSITHIRHDLLTALAEELS